MLTFDVTHKHPMLGKLKINFSVREDGTFWLNTLEIRYRRVSYANWHFWTLHFWSDDESRWNLNFWTSRWSNGMPDTHGAYPDDKMNDFLPELLAFVNSEAFAQAIARKLKRSMKQMRTAMNGLTAVRS